MLRTRNIFTASTGSVNVCGASPSTCACQPRSTIDQSACLASHALARKEMQSCVRAL